MAQSENIECPHFAGSKTSAVPVPAKFIPLKQQRQASEQAAALHQQKKSEAPIISSQSAPAL